MRKLNLNKLYIPISHVRARLHIKADKTELLLIELNHNLVDIVLEIFDKCIRTIVRKLVCSLL